MKQNRLFAIWMAVMIVIGIAYNASSQEFELIKKGSKLTDTTIVVDGQSFDARVNLTTNNWSIERISKKSGNTYTQYLGYKTAMMYGPDRIYTDSKKEKYWILRLGKTGYPSKQYLSKK